MDAFTLGERQALKWLTARPVAHRGLHDVAAGRVENTSSAVQAAIDHDYAIEVDLQLTGDGEAVVLHDYELGRLTHASGRVIEKTTAELKQVSFKAGSDRIQTLSELLEQVNGKVALILEIKSRWTDIGALEHRVSNVLHDYEGPFAVMSFDPQCMVALKEIAPYITRGVVSERFQDDPEWRALPFWRQLSLRHGNEIAGADPHFLNFHVGGLPYGPTRLFRKLNRPILSWTVRTNAQREKAARYADQMVFEGFCP